MAEWSRNLLDVICVEENPGPTIYDVDPGNTKKFKQNAGKQCVAMSLTTTIIYNEITDINVWDSLFLNIICVLEIAFILV